MRQAGSKVIFRTFKTSKPPLSRVPAMDNRQRREFLNQVYRLGLASAVTTFSPLLWLSSRVHSFGKIPKELPANQSIFEMQGDVRVNGETANEKTFIKADALIETGSNSYVIFKVGKDAHILRENSRMQLQGSNVLETGLNLFTGKVLSVFGERSKNQKKHTLRTSTATIGIRGTGVYAESHEDSSYLCTCYGNTLIESQNQLSGKSQQEEIKATHHDAPRFILKEPEKGKLIVPAPVFNHTDEELILIETIVGRESPISAIQSYSSPRRGY